MKTYLYDCIKAHKFKAGWMHNYCLHYITLVWIHIFYRLGFLLLHFIDITQFFISLWYDNIIWVSMILHLRKKIVKIIINIIKQHHTRIAVIFLSILVSGFKTTEFPQSYLGTVTGTTSSKLFWRNLCIATFCATCQKLHSLWNRSFTFET